jgi:hypothetical protein
MALNEKKKMVLGFGLAAAGFFITALLVACAAMGSADDAAPDRMADIRGSDDGGLEAASAVTSSINYQGRLTDSGGNPLSGTYTVTFSLYETATGGTALRTDTQSVTVTDGLFSTTISLGYYLFDGRALWLGIKVGSDPEMTPRQELRPVPYALSLRPGAVINVTDPWGYALGVMNDGVNGCGILTIADTGVESRSLDESGYGVYASTLGDYSTGVYASTSGNYSTGVYAYTEADNSDGVIAFTNGDNSNGVFARTWGSYSLGVYARALGYNSEGVYAYSSQYNAILAETRRADHNYGFYTYDNIYVGGKIDLVGTVDPIIVEAFKADDKVTYAIGDVVCLDESGTVKPCSKADDTKVVGVVGPTLELEDGELTVVIMGHQGAKPDEEHVQVLEKRLARAEARKAEFEGTAERADEKEQIEREITMLKSQLEEAKSITRQVVRVKADANYGAIKAGDLLTTSSTKGHAMKAQPVDVGGVEIYRPGTIIGKALEPLESGTGLIEVFVTLQ